MNPSLLGQTLGNYRIVSQLGEGGMGVVYRAHDEVLHRDVAIKLLTSRTIAARPAKGFLLDEARAVSALSHPNICTIHQVGETEAGLYIVMELVEGKPLNALAAKEGLPVESVLRYGTQIARALAHLHARGIIHRDLKSANVMVTSDGLVKVLDFGLARRLRQEDLAESESVTLDQLDPTTNPTTKSTGGLTGTLPYMPPEVLSGKEADHLGDIWALGVVLYEAACGKLPFLGRTSFETSSAILRELPPPLPNWFPTGLSSIIQRCLSKDMHQRYQRASEVQAALEAVQSASVAAPPSPGAAAGPATTVVRGIRHVNVKDGDVLLLVGTTKGAFLLRAGAQRSRWDVVGPAFHGNVIYSMAYDPRQGRHHLWASTSTYWGTFLRSSDDFGRKWTNPVHANVKFPEDCGLSLKNIWQICPGRESEADTLYCGVEPAALFVSHDSGDTWSLMRGLFDHPHRPRWVPGNGGLALHTILLDPANDQRMYVAISAGGVYRSDDGGGTWQARNRGIRVNFQPNKEPEFGQCVHKMVLHPDRPERIFLQHHWGLYRSDDHADSWQSISNGVPSDFGFAMIMHPRDPDCVYIVPVESDEFRCAPDGKLRVYRTRDAGNCWEPLTRGLPQKGAYETVLRDAMSTDGLDPAGIYFGTRSGELFASTDEGKSWKMIVSGFPPIVCVKAVAVGEPRSTRIGKPGRRPQAPSARSKKNLKKKIKRVRR